MYRASSCFGVFIICFLLFDSFSREEKDRNLEAVSAGLQPLIIGFFRMKRHVERFVTSVTRRSSAVGQLVFFIDFKNPTLISSDFNYNPIVEVKIL